MFKKLNYHFNLIIFLSPVSTRRQKVTNDKYRFICTKVKQWDLESDGLDLSLTLPFTSLGTQDSYLNSVSYFPSVESYVSNSTYLMGLL